MPTISSRNRLLDQVAGDPVGGEASPDGASLLLTSNEAAPATSWPVDEDCEVGADLSEGPPTRRRSPCRKTGILVVGALLLASVVNWAQRSLVASVAGSGGIRLRDGYDPAIVGEQGVFDCDAGVADDRWKRAWSTAKMIYCCSHFRKGCPGFDEAAVAFVLTNIRYTDLIASTEVFARLKTAVKQKIVDRVGMGITTESVDLLYWESSGIFSTVPDQEAVGIVLKCIVHVPPPNKPEDAIDMLNQTALLRAGLESAAQEASLGDLAPGDVQAKSILVEPKIVDQCTCRNGIPQQGDLCPTFGGEICKTCDMGYSLTDGNFCIENKCYCTDGFGAVGSACPQDGALWCASCFRGFGLVQDLEQKERVCVQNSCRCMNGTASVGASCGQDKAMVCSECDPGFHLDANLTCQENTCSCPEGIAATGVNCTKHAAVNCQSCDSGFHVDERGICMRNRCQCDNGQVALGQLCHTNGAQVCAYCYSVFHLRKDGSCGDKECFCKHGTAKTGLTCRTHKSIACEKCDQGYFMNNGQCISEGCMCHNGVAVGHSECPVPGEHVCKECHPGYTLNRATQLCEANICECGNGTAAVGATCRVTGSLSCAACNEGFHIGLENVKDQDGAVMLRVACEPNVCECKNGVPATESSGTLCHTDGANVCQSCDMGYHFSAQTNEHDEVIGHACAVNQCTCKHGVPVESSECSLHEAQNCSVCDNGFFPLKEPMLEFEPGSGHEPPKEDAFTGDNVICAASGLTTSLPFDCNVALANWESAWSRLKKRWCCSTKNLGCRPQASQTEMCENKGYNLEQCTLIGCCQFDPVTRTCSHATGDGSNVCHPEYNMKTAGGQCVTAQEHHYGAVVKRTLTLERCDSANTGQDWAPSSRGHGIAQIEDVGGLCLTVDDQVDGNVTADSCVIAQRPNEGTDKQTISFLPLPGHPSVGFLRTKNSFCLSAAGGRILVAQCNPMDENQQFTTTPASTSMVGGDPNL